MWPRTPRMGSLIAARRDGRACVFLRPTLPRLPGVIEGSATTLTDAKADGDVAQAAGRDGSDGDRAVGRHALPQRGRHAGDVHREGPAGAARARDRRRGHRRRQRQHRRLAGHRRSARRARGRRVDATRLRRRADGRHRRSARAVRLMGDADDSYDFLELPKFVDKLREGYDLVQGCRLARGGGQVLPGAMPFLHRWWGNPMFSAMARRWFRAPIHDVYCGTARLHPRALRAARPALHGHGVRDRDDHQSRAWQRARSPRCRSRCTRTAARRTRRICSTFRDGWRTLRFFLMYSPRWLFLIPGLLLMIARSDRLRAGHAGRRTVRRQRSTPTRCCSPAWRSSAGYQSILFAVFTKMFAIDEGLLPPDPRMARFTKHLSLEKGLIGGGLVAVLGLVLLLIAVLKWSEGASASSTTRARCGSSCPA